MSAAVVVDITKHWNWGEDLPAEEPATPARAEADDQAEGAGRPVPVKLPNLPADFWEARNSLRVIRQAAHSRGRSADVVFGAAITRLAAMAHHGLIFRTCLGPGSLNTFCAAVAPSGIGKSTGAGVAKELIIVPGYLDPTKKPDAFHDGLPLGTGEGLAEAYMGTVDVEDPTKKPDRHGNPKYMKVRKQVRNNAFIYVDEGQSLMKMLERSGATVGPTLRSAWNGELIGQANGRDETTRVIRERTYSLGLLIGFQYHTAQPLLADAGAGTPQRFLFLSAIDPSVPHDPPRWPGSIEFPLEVTGSSRKWEVEHQGGVARTGVITFADSIEAHLWTENMARVHGESVAPELDSHKSLMLCKVAALLAVMEGADSVTAEDWELAEAVWSTSCAVRDRLVAWNEAETRRQNEARRADRVETEVAAHIGKRNADQKLEILARWVASKVREFGPGPVLRSFIRKRLDGDRKPLFEQGVDEALSRRWVAVDPSDQRRLVRGEVEPAA